MGIRTAHPSATPGRAGHRVEISFTWYGPDGAVTDVTAYGDTALAHLNRAGAQGWELVSVTEDPTLPGHNELHRYHLKRPARIAPRQRVRGRTGRRPLPR